MNNIKSLSKKWYDFLEFPKEYDSFFDKILLRDDINEELLKKDVKELLESGDTELCLVYALLKCEETEKKYNEKGISNDIFCDTALDIKLWATDYFSRTGVLGLDLLAWVASFLDLKLFRLGRLQFNFSPSIVDCPEKGIRLGDNTLGVHIPKNDPFTPEAWEKSFLASKEFFPKYFPEFEYKYYSCSSWFLSPDLDLFLDENSNIIKFKKLFDVIDVSEKDIMLSFLFSWGATREDLPNLEAKTSLQKKIKEYVLAGNKLHSGYGIIEK